jgi:NodT family efflux transporter outer membrane factor (OMF) lipoprotein
MGVDTDPRPPFELPAEFQGDKDGKDPGKWWTTFNDKELNLLIDQAIGHNFQLMQAWARLDQAKALERGAMAGMFPTVGANASASRSKSPPRVFQLPGQPATEVPGVESNAFSSSLPVSYEVDLWGRVRAGMFAAEQDTIAARADVEAAAMTIAANVTERWFDVIEQRAARRLILEQTAVNKTNLELVMMRFEQNEAALSDVFQQRQQIQGLDVQMATVTGTETVAMQQLALLLGTGPKKLVDASRIDLPTPPPLPKAGIPASMLERRPDLRAAKARVVAADYRIAQAIAARLPSLTLSGSLGFSAVELGSFFESFVWQIMGQISGTIWDGGRGDAEVQRSKAVLRERMAAYGQVLLTALVEVESALVLEKQAGQQIAILEAQLDTAQKTLDAARSRFAVGIGSYLATLTALRSLQQVEQNLLSAKRRVLAQRVQVYRALGSSWTKELKAPKHDDDEGDEEEGS